MKKHRRAKWLGLDVVVKKFDRRSLNSSDQAVKNFIKEVTIMHSLRHPNIALFMGLSIDAEKLHAYTVSEWIKGGSLFKYLHAGSLPAEATGTRILTEHQAFFFARQIANAVFYLHNHGIQHGDLSSQNVLICEDWKIKLCNFALSNKEKEETVVDKKDNHKKLYWMAPETVRGESGGKPADVYSFGVLIWEMLTG